MTTSADGPRTPDDPGHMHRGKVRDQHSDSLIEIDGTSYSVVRAVDRMPPFLMSVVSDGDRWMFVSSGGGLTAGRRNALGALFPYETDDRLHLLSGLSGPATAIRLSIAHPDDVWRPMMGRAREQRSRTLYKSVIGDSIMFDESDPATGLTFRYRWATSERFGFVRTSTIINEGDGPQTVDIIDGLVNILPHGLDPSLYLPMGNLANAYKRAELVDPDAGMAVYSLESLMTDRAEPSEAMRASVAWSTGFEEAMVSLLPDAIHRFESGEVDLGGALVTGRPGAYFLNGALELGPGESKTWQIVVDGGLDQPDVASLHHQLRELGEPHAELADSIDQTSRSLIEIMARADALQCTADDIAVAHHYSNVTYNVMRGGIPMDGYEIDVMDFADHLSRHNVTVAVRYREMLSALGTTISRRDLLEAIGDTEDVDLIRLGHDYLPFSFSRRHGDPSRPWNVFSIRVAGPDGRPRKYYEGNWRDIFQNWEATCMSFPEYLPDMVSLFVNASTRDGFNPYRLTSDGIEWEVPEPDNPWANIGYWGDHQITYLLRLLEESDRYEPGAIDRLLTQRRFTYADVPYRIVPYNRLLTDPKSTIEYDESAATAAEVRVASVGADGRLVWKDGSPHHVTLTEKLIVPALAKLSNFIPGAGIWMNTQRPEWNDANNALVGYGVSMVTLYQLRRYLEHLRTLVTQSSADEVAMTSEVADWLLAVTEILQRAPVEADAAIADRVRKQIVDALGSAFEGYRAQCYASGFTSTQPVNLSDVRTMCDVAIPHVDRTIAANKRPDGLFGSYNLMKIADDGAAMFIDHLGPMLEGQVAAIESGALGADGCADVVDALFSSSMYRSDQDSFMLYPASRLPPFLERNIVPRESVDANPLLLELLDRSDASIVVVDADARVRFSAELETKEALEAQLDELAADPTLEDLVSRCTTATIRTYEDVFGHHQYTGRSGSMYGYEGIGSIYWHMVAKLLVAIQDAAFRARAAGEADEAIDRLRIAYWRIRSGLGFNKTPDEHGAIPIDPYSHTPAHAGAQQPGMTGLVKEELLTRPAELGVIVTAGEIRLDGLFMGATEMLTEGRDWSTLTPSLEWLRTDLPAGSVGFTISQVPMVVSRVEGETEIEVEYFDGTIERFPGATLGRSISRKIFGRTGEVVRVRGRLPLDG